MIIQTSSLQRIFFLPAPSRSPPIFDTRTFFTKDLLAHVDDHLGIYLTLTDSTLRNVSSDQSFRLVEALRCSSSVLRANLYHCQLEVLPVNPEAPHRTPAGGRLYTSRPHFQTTLDAWYGNTCHRAIQGLTSRQWNTTGDYFNRGNGIHASSRWRLADSILRASRQHCLASI
jgi:hypothetical protein